MTVKVIVVAGIEGNTVEVDNVNALEPRGSSEPIGLIQARHVPMGNVPPKWKPPPGAPS